MIKGKCGFLGIGAYGGNQVLPFYKAGYPSLFINTAHSDLDSLKDVDETHKFHLSGGEGCNKDRKKSKNLIKKNLDAIINEIKEKMPGIEYLFVVGSLGGGTGAGGIAPLKQVVTYELNLKASIIITVLPNTKESVQALINSYDTLAEIESLEEPGTTFILDNDKNNNKMKINDMFFCYLDTMLTCNCNSTMGNVDDAEFEQLLSANGVSIISKLGRDKSDTANLINTFHNNIYAPLETDRVIKYVGLVNMGTGKNINIEDIHTEVGTPLDTYIGYEADYTLCILSGCSFPYEKMENIKEIIESKKDEVTRNLTAQNNKRLSGLNFFDGIKENKQEEKKRKSDRDWLL